MVNFIEEDWWKKSVIKNFISAKFCWKKCERIVQIKIDCLVKNNILTRVLQMDIREKLKCFKKLETPCRAECSCVRAYWLPISKLNIPRNPRIFCKNKLILVMDQRTMKMVPVYFIIKINLERFRFFTMVLTFFDRVYL